MARVMPATSKPIIKRSLCAPATRSSSTSGLSTHQVARAGSAPSARASRGTNTASKRQADRLHEPDQQHAEHEVRAGDRHHHAHDSQEQRTVRRRRVPPERIDGAQHVRLAGVREDRRRVAIRIDPEMHERPLREVAVRVLAEQRRREQQWQAPGRADDPQLSRGEREPAESEPRHRQRHDPAVKHGHAATAQRRIEPPLDATAGDPGAGQRDGERPREAQGGPRPGGPPCSDGSGRHPGHCPPGVADAAQVLTRSLP